MNSSDTEWALDEGSSSNMTGSSTEAPIPSGCDPLTPDEIALYMTISWWFEGLLQVRKAYLDYCMPLNHVTEIICTVESHTQLY